MFSIGTFTIASSFCFIQVLTLLAKTIEENLVLSRPLCQETNYAASQQGRKHILRIRKDMDMSVYIVALDEAEKRYLSEEAYGFYQSFNSTCVNEHIFPEDPVWPQFERIQSSLYRNMRPDASVELLDNTSKQLEKQKKKKDADQGTTEALYQNTVINNTPKSQHRPQRPGDYQTLTETKPDEVGNSPFWEIRPISPDGFPGQDEKEKAREGVTEELLLELMMEVNTANRQMSIQVCKECLQL